MSDSKPPKRSTSEDKRALANMLQQPHRPLPPPPQLLDRKLRSSLEDVGEPRRRPQGTTTRRPAPLMRSGLDNTLNDRPRPGPLAERTADLHRAELLDLPRGMPLRPPLPAYAAPAQPIYRKGWFMALAALLSIAVLLALRPNEGAVIGNYISRAAGGLNNLQGAPAAPAAPLGEHSVLGVPTITAAQIDQVLEQLNSPARGTGQIWIDLGQRYGIDPAYALAFFIHESSAGTNPGWAGLKPGGGTTYNIGNIICAGYPTCFGRFRDYQSWSEGIEDWYKLIAREYVEGRGVFTVEQIIPIYAPSFENNVPAYVNAVVSLVEQWRSQGGG